MIQKRTENTAMIVGLGKAAELVNKHLVEYASNMLKCRDYLEQRLKVNDQFSILTSIVRSSIGN